MLRNGAGSVCVYIRYTQILTGHGTRKIIRESEDDNILETFTFFVYSNLYVKNA